jgi:hypothetical protein
MPAHRLGRDADGGPCLLLDVCPPGPGQAAPLGIELAHLRVHHGVRCRLVRRGAAEERTMTVIRLVGTDREIRTQFLRVVAPLLQDLGVRPAADAVARTVRQLVDLFRALEQPARRAVQGLWAELLVIAQARNAETVVRAWHGGPGDRYDFVAGPERVEVKSAGRGGRAHHFSLDQLTVTPGTSLVIGSVLVEAVGGGTSLGELLGEVRARVAADPELSSRVDRIVFDTLGDTLGEALGLRFDRQLATESLAWFDGPDVPRVARPLPAAVSQVQFRADLSGVPPLTVAAVRGRGPLGAAFV